MRPCGLARDLELICRVDRQRSPALVYHSCSVHLVLSGRCWSTGDVQLDLAHQVIIHIYCNIVSSTRCYSTGHVSYCVC